ncbi:hypothetical protein [Limnothrix sp. FACHB-881]|nr:hypothetical protein [Limnothrix sp. FACHB-881]
MDILTLGGPLKRAGSPGSSITEQSPGNHQAIARQRLGDRP